MVAKALCRLNACIAFTLVFALAPVAFGADVDLSAAGIQISPNQGGGYVITYTVGLDEENGDGDFSMAVSLEQWRNGELIAVLADDEYMSSPEDSCPPYPYYCGGDCHYTVIGWPAASGTCVISYVFETCSCFATVGRPTIVPSLATGDIIVFRVDPAPGTNDPRQTNNTFTAQFGW